MKLHDFGLWFHRWSLGHGDKNRWLTTIPEIILNNFHIYYDGVHLGQQYEDFHLHIYNDVPYTIKLAKDFPIYNEFYGIRPFTIYSVGRHLMLDDFKIVKNPDYKGNE